MGKNKRRQLVMSLMVMIGLIMGSKIQTLHASIKERDISLAEVHHTKNGGKLSVRKDKNEELRILHTTKGEKKGYYTASFFNEQTELLEDRDILSYHIATKNNLRINANILVRTGENPVIIKDGSQLMLKPDNKKNYIVCVVENGTFEIPAGFRGTVYLPIRTEGRVYTDGFGLITVLERNCEADYVVSAMKLSNSFERKEHLFDRQFIVKETGSLEIPVYGEYYYQQKVHLKNSTLKKRDCKFFMEEEVEGVHISQDGKLRISDKAKAGSILISVQIDKQLRYQYQVRLIDSWLKSMENDVVKDFLVQHPDKVKPGPKVIRIPYKGIRWFMASLAAGFTIFYIWVIKGKVR